MFKFPFTFNPETSSLLLIFIKNFLSSLFLSLIIAEQSKYNNGYSSGKFKSPLHLKKFLEIFEIKKIKNFILEVI